MSALRAVLLLACTLAACKDTGVIGQLAPLECSATTPCKTGERCNDRSHCEPCEDVTCGLRDAEAEAEPDAPACAADASCPECEDDSDCGGALPFCDDARCTMCREDEDCTANDAQCEDGTCVVEDEEEEQESDNSGPGNAEDP